MPQRPPTSPLKAPLDAAGLGPRGARFKAQTEAVFDLTEGENLLLLEVARSLDEIEALNDAVLRDGITVPGHAGQTRVHPAVGEARQHRLLIAKLLHVLDLPGEESTVTPAQLRGRKAAAARWNKTRVPGGSA
jgi:hypothetical protein